MRAASARVSVIALVALLAFAGDAEARRHHWGSSRRPARSPTEEKFLLVVTLVAVAVAGLVNWAQAQERSSTPVRSPPPRRRGPTRGPTHGPMAGPRPARPTEEAPLELEPWGALEAAAPEARREAVEPYLRGLVVEVRTTLGTGDVAALASRAAPKLLERLRAAGERGRSSGASVTDVRVTEVALREHRVDPGTGWIHATFLLAFTESIRRRDGQVDRYQVREAWKLGRPPGPPSASGLAAWRLTDLSQGDRRRLG